MEKKMKGGGKAYGWDAGGKTLQSHPTNSLLMLPSFPSLFLDKL